MKYWLIFMLFNSDGEYINKFEYQLSTMAECQSAAAYAAKRFVNRDVLTQAWCVTDDHHAGRSVDPGIPLD